MAILLGIGAFVLLFVIFLVVIGLREAREVDPLQARLADYAAQGISADLEDIELSQPLTERIIFPMARKLGSIVLRFTPQNAINQTTHKLELAGNPGRLDPTLFWALRLVGVGLGGILYFVARIAPEGSFLEGRGFLIAIPAGVLGFFLPELWLRGRINNRQSEIRKAMPDALDLLTICVEAGLGFDAAMAKVNEKWNNALSQGFGRVLRDIQLGKLRREALRDMADRMGVSELTSFVAAVIQS